MRAVSAVAAGVAALLAVSARATVITIDFENIIPDPHIYGESYIPVLEYYNGGTSASGSSGPNLGVAFSDTAYAFCIDKPTLGCAGSNTAKGGAGPAASRFTAIFLNAGTPDVRTIVNVAAGFDTGFAFTYAALLTASVEVFDGIDGTGTSLGLLALPVTPSTCPAFVKADYCPFVANGLGFAGIGRSVVLSGFTNSTVFDDLTFGSSTIVPGSVPEPASWLMLTTGFGLAGTALRRRRVLGEASQRSLP